MREVETIVGIYNFFNPRPEEIDESGFYLLYLLDERGLLELGGARKLFLNAFNEANYIDAKYIGPFDTFERLNQFAFALCENVNAARISLLSAQEYNSVLESHQQVVDFHQDLLAKGNVIENIERKKKGFLNRFFD